MGQFHPQKILIISPLSMEDPNQPPERIQHLRDSLSDLGWDARIDIASSVDELTRALDEFQPALVWSAVYRLSDSLGTQINCHEVLKGLDVPWVGSDPDVLDLVLAKDRLKDHWRKFNVNTPDWKVIRQADDLRQWQSWNKFPAIVKPCEEGNSRGLTQESIVSDPIAADRYIRRALPRFQSLFLEQYLGDDPDLHEYTVAVIGNGPDRFYMPAEIILDSQTGKRIITTEDKDQHHTRAIPVEDMKRNGKIQEFALSACETACVQDYARLDVLYSGGKFYAIEINGQPMLPDLWFDTCAKLAGFDRHGYIHHIIQAAVSRWESVGFQFIGNPGRLGTQPW